MRLPASRISSDLDHLKKGLSDSENDVLFVGYQATGTTGRDIIKYNRKKNGHVSIDGETVFLKAAVHQLTGYSAHADQKGLIDWVEQMPVKPSTIKLVHGDAPAREALAQKLAERGTWIF